MKQLPLFIFLLTLFLFTFSLPVNAATATASASPSPSSTSSATTLPQTGIETPFLVITAMGILFFATGSILKKLSPQAI